MVWVPADRKLDIKSYASLANFYMTMVYRSVCCSVPTCIGLRPILPHDPWYKPNDIGNQYRVPQVYQGKEGLSDSPKLTAEWVEEAIGNACGKVSWAGDKYTLVQKIDIESAQGMIRTLEIVPGSKQAARMHQVLMSLKDKLGRDIAVEWIGWDSATPVAQQMDNTTV